MNTRQYCANISLSFIWISISFGKATTILPILCRHTYICVCVCVCVCTCVYCESLLCFFMGQKRPFCSISNICDALPSPLTRQYVRLCHTLFSAALLKLIQEVCMGIRSGVSNQSCVSCEGTSHVRLPHTKPVCSPVSAPTLGWTPC